MGGGRAGIRIPGQDARGPDDRSGDRPGLPGRRADDAAPPGAAPAGCRGRVRGVGRLVRGAHPGVAGVVAALHRRLDRRQLHESGAGLQRFCASARPQSPEFRTERPARQLGRQRPPARRRLRRDGQPEGRVEPPVHRRVRFRDRLADSRSAARGPARVDRTRARTAHRSGSRRCAAVRRLAGDRRSGAQLHEGHGAPVLLPLAGARGRGHGRHRGPRDVGTQTVMVRPDRGDHADRGDRHLELGGVGPQRRLDAGLAMDDPGRCRGRCRRGRGVCLAPAPGGGGRRRTGCGGGAGRPDRLCGGHAGYAASGWRTHRRAVSAEDRFRSGFRRIEGQSEVGRSAAGHHHEVVGGHLGFVGRGRSRIVHRHCRYGDRRLHRK